MKKLIFRLIILAVIVGAAYGSYRLMQQLPQRQAQIATAKVRKGDIVVRTFARGELRAVRSAPLLAPNLFGTVQVTKLAQVGSFAREKDLIVEFDDAELQSRVEEKQLEIDQIDEQYKKSEADLAIRNNQDQVELLRARYSVRRAELEVKRNELLSDIDKKKNQLNLEESKRRLQQLQSDIKSRQEQAEAELAVLRERKQKAQLEMTRERARLNQVKVLAPMSGLVAIKQNNTNRFGFGFDVPDIREGDQVQPGMAIADVLDLSELEVIARVGELDRANLSENQEVTLALDAVPNKKFRGRIKMMSSTATANVFSSDPAKKFDVTFDVDMKELLTALGAKPDQVQRILATAEANRKKPPIFSFAAMMPSMAGGPGAVQGGGPVAIQGGPVAVQGGPGAGAPAPPGAPGIEPAPSGAPAAPEAGGGVSPAERRRMEAALQEALKGRNVQNLSAEERTKIFQEVQAKVRSSRPSVIARAEAGGEGNAAGGGRRRREGGEAGPRPTGPFTQADIDNAKLPPPPDQDSNLDILLRPGLLADVEIIVEKIPNAVHVPAQAVFERDGKLVVYVKESNKFVARPVRLGKRSESTLVIAEGLKEGETIAMADPEAKPGSKKDDSKGGSGGPMNALPGGKS